MTTIFVPGSPLVGVKLIIAGAGMDGFTVKLDAEVAVPFGVTTLITPLTAPDGTVAVICVAELTVNVAATLPKRTELAPVKFVPVIVTDAPTTPLVGAKLVIVGSGAKTVNDDGEVAVPFGVMTVITPLTAAGGTLAVICVAVFDVMTAAKPPKRTRVAPERFVPVMVMIASGSPLVGVKPVMAGVTGAVTVNTAVVVRLFIGVWSLMTPDCCPAVTRI